MDYFAKSAAQGHTEAQQVVERYQQAEARSKEAGKVVAAGIRVLLIAAIASSASSDKSTEGSADPSSTATYEADRRKRRQEEADTRTKRADAQYLCHLRGGTFYPGAGASIGVCSK
jgi:hypothetical protein